MPGAFNITSPSALRTLMPPAPSPHQSFGVWEQQAGRRDTKTMMEGTLWVRLPQVEPARYPEQRNSPRFLG